MERLSDRVSKLESALTNPTSESAKKQGRHAPCGAASSLECFVTREELAEALNLAEKAIGVSIADRFERQSLAIGSLRAMITDTDALLERVLDRLETLTPEPDSHLSDDENTTDNDDSILSLKKPR